MAKYKDLKRERDEAIERAVVAERNSQLETLERERATHREQIAALNQECARLQHAARLAGYSEGVEHAALRDLVSPYSQHNVAPRNTSNGGLDPESSLEVFRER